MSLGRRGEVRVKSIVEKSLVRLIVVEKSKKSYYHYGKKNFWASMFFVLSVFLWTQRMREHSVGGDTASLFINITKTENRWGTPQNVF